MATIASYFQQFSLAFVIFMLWKLFYYCYLKPTKAYLNLQKHGFRGPKPSFPLGNLRDMKGKKDDEKENTTEIEKRGTSAIHHDIHSTSFPHFARWQKSYGKVYLYWMGTEPFVYIADPEFLKQMSRDVVAKDWGKPDVFRADRIPMFGKYGLNVIEGNDWIRHRHITTPAFSVDNLKVMTNLMVESTTTMMNRWTATLAGNSAASSSKLELNMEDEITNLAGEIIARTNFGVSEETGETLLGRLRSMQTTLFKHKRYVGVPFGKLLTLKQTLEAQKLGKEVDRLILSVIKERVKLIGLEPQRDLLGLLLMDRYNKDRKRFVEQGDLSTRELVDECKTFFFGGHETVALAITWTLLLLAMYPKWQEELREEIKQVVGDKSMDFSMLSRLKKMGWVLNEVLRLYPSSPNVQRQAKSDVRVVTDDQETTIPKGTNIWIDLVSMHHDKHLWGEDANEFKPERFRDDVLYGGCKHKMGYLPFGFGGRMCIGRNYAIMEHKIVLALLLSEFSFSVSPSYRHSPSYFFSFRPGRGVQLLVRRL